MLFHSPEMHIQLVQVLQQGAEGCACGQKALISFGEALAAITEHTIGTGNVGVGVLLLWYQPLSR